MTNLKKAYLFTLLAVLFWAGAATAFKIALNYMSPFLLLFYSAIISALALLFVLIFQGKSHLLFRQDKSFYLRSLLMGLINPFLFYLVLFKGYDLLPGQIAMALNFGWPITLSVLSIPLLKQKVSLRQFLAIIVSFIGAVIIATRGEMFSFEGISLLGVILTIGSTFIWATFWLLNTKDKADPVLRLFFGFCAAVIYLLMVSFLFDGIRIPDPQSWPALIYVGLFEMGITFVLWISALKLAPSAARISQLIYLTPFLSLVVLYIGIGEQIYLSTFIGLLCIVISIAYQSLQKPKH